MHGFSISPGRQSHTVPQRSRGALAALAGVVYGPAFEPPHPATAAAARASAARKASVDTRAEDGIGRLPSTLAHSFG